MALEDSMALARVRIPDPHAGIQTASGDASAIKRDSIDLAEVARERP